MSNPNWKCETNDKNKSAKKSSSIDKEQKSKKLPIYKGIQPNSITPHSDEIKSKPKGTPKDTIHYNGNRRDNRIKRRNGRSKRYDR